MFTHLIIVIERSTGKELKSYVVQSNKSSSYDVRREHLITVEQEVKYGSLKTIRDIDWCLDSVLID